MDPFIGQIMFHGFNYAPNDWALCQGQQLPISQNAALFSLLGTTYGGNGQTTFALPDARGRGFFGFGQSTTGIGYVQGETAGSESVVMTTNQMPAHNHSATFTPTGGGGPIAVSATLQATVVPPAQRKTGQTNAPAAGSMLGAATDSSSIGSTPVIYVPATGTGTPVNLGGLSVSASGGGITGGSVAVGVTGGNQPLPIMQPFQVVGVSIALQGIFPPRP